MKVLNIVPVEMLEVAKTKMIAAVDWSLERWNEEGKVAAQDLEGEEGRIDVDSIIEGEIGRKRGDHAAAGHGNLNVTETQKRMATEIDAVGLHRGDRARGVDGSVALD